MPLPGGGQYQLYRLAIIGVGVLVAIGLYWLIARTRLGMRIRAGESDREMIGALGVDISTLYTVVFALGAALAGFAGALVGALQSVQVGMGEPVLILAFVVIVIGVIRLMLGGPSAGREGDQRHPERPTLHQRAGVTSARLAGARAPDMLALLLELEHQHIVGQRSIDGRHRSSSRVSWSAARSGCAEPGTRRIIHP